MTLRLKINLIVGALTLLFVAAVLGLQFRSMRESVHEEVLAANRVAAQMLNRTTDHFGLIFVPCVPFATRHERTTMKFLHFFLLMVSRGISIT